MATLADRSGVSRRILQRAINDEGELEDEQIKSVAEELAVPVQVLFVAEQFSLFPSVDFRTANPSIGEFSKGTLQAISFVERISSTFASLGLPVGLDRSVEQYKTDTYSPSDAIKLAKIWRDKWGVSDSDQLDWQDANKVYVSLRSYIESLGILVMHRQFKTDEAAGIYLHVDGGPHTIVINTTGSSKARKLFTLAHEFGHVLLRAEGASNPSILKNKIERFCNRFAACLLAPKKLVAEALTSFGYRPIADDDFIRLFAAKLGISQEATYLRLVELGYLKAADYARWKAKFSNRGNVPTGDTTDGGGGGGTPNPIRDKQTQYGTAFLRLLNVARAAGQLDDIDIYRLCGLKPHYQDQLLGSR